MDSSQIDCMLEKPQQMIVGYLIEHFQVTF